MQDGKHHNCLRTRQYFAGTTPLAIRQDDDTLHYLLNDPTGTQLTVSDESGIYVGSVLYDAFGAVLTSTLPVTLTRTLPDAPDPTTGLVHLGGGRWYNPALGRPLQPNPAGSPPTVPQALNRYAATVVGQPGVYQAAQSESALTSIAQAVGQNAISAASGMALSAYANSLTGELFIQANNQLLARAGYQNLFGRVLSPGRGNSAFYYTGLVKSAGNRTYRSLATDQVIDLAHLEAHVVSKRWPVRYPAGEAFGALDDNVARQFLRTGGGEFLAGFGVNLLLAGPDLAAPWDNPYFSTEQRVAQNMVTVSGAAASAGAARWVGKLAAASSLGGPVTFVLVTASGVVVWVGWEYTVKPTVSWTFVNVFNATDPYQEYRNLQPLGGQ